MTLEATAYVGELCDDVGAIDEAMALTQQVYNALLRLVRNGGDEEVRCSSRLKGHMSLSDCATFPPSTVETASPMSIVVFTRDGATEIGLRARDRDENRTRACSMDLLPQLRPRSPP